MINSIYKENSANYPRIKTDVFFADYSNEYKYDGFMDKSIKFIEYSQLLNPTLWNRFVRQYSESADNDNGWRGEYWGKMMRGACFVYSYTKNPELYSILAKTVEDMMKCAEDSGRISAYPVEVEFDGWDLWCRKYVLLGMQYFLEICDDDELKEKIVSSMKGQVDYIISNVGKEEGKIAITKAANYWAGVNSSSILEPIVRLYSLTNERKYLDFAEYIVDCGGTDIANIFELAYENELYPYQYPVTKAYEMISCFEGLLEYYRIVGDEKYKTMVLNFANKILESDFTVIGSCGCTHELFDHSTVRQANTTNGEIAQETCVTVTLMKFLYQMTLLSGDTKYIDAFEISLYNAYLGAINTEKVVEPTTLEKHPDWIAEPLPFDSYSPLTAGMRGKVIGGQREMSDKHYYGCCACIGSAGIGLVPKMQLMTKENGFAMNLYINGIVSSETPNGSKAVFVTLTDYPKNGEIIVELGLENSEEFELLLRVPEWSEKTGISINGEDVDVTDSYTAINRVWKSGDTVKLTFDMRTKANYPISYGSQLLYDKVVWDGEPELDTEDPIAHKHIALRRGPVMLAQENRLGYSVDDAIEVKVGVDGYVDVVLTDDNIPYENIIGAKVPLADAGDMLVTDYSSAGKLWTEESKMAVWMLTK